MQIDRECGTKLGYLTKADAKRVARFMGSRHREDVHLYRCPHCALWHVGHVVPAGIRAAIQRFPTRRVWRVEASW